MRARGWKDGNSPIFYRTSPPFGLLLKSQSETVGKAEKTWRSGHGFSIKMSFFLNCNNCVMMTLITLRSTGENWKRSRSEKKESEQGRIRDTVAPSWPKNLLFTDRRSDFVAIKNEAVCMNESFVVVWERSERITSFEGTDRLKHSLTPAFCCH